jgi:PAS domain S-box-containing protein
VRAKSIVAAQCRAANGEERAALSGPGEAERAPDSLTLRALLDSIADPIVFADSDHVIRYLNPAAARQHAAKGRTDLLGKSLADCHKPESMEKIRRIHAQLQDGVDEVFEAVNRKNQRVFVRAVRDDDRRLLGYYERFEPNADPKPVPGTD